MWEDTVMTEEQLAVFWHNPSECNDVGIAEAQAEITGNIAYNKAMAQLAEMTEECKRLGRKEVVELDKLIADHIMTVPYGNKDYHIESWRIKNWLKKRQAKLKEWKLNPTE